MHLIVKRGGKAAAAFCAEKRSEEGAALKIERKGVVFLRGSLCGVERRQLGAQGCSSLSCGRGRCPGLAGAGEAAVRLLLRAPAPSLPVKYQRVGSKSGFAGRGKKAALRNEGAFAR